MLPLPGDLSCGCEAGFEPTEYGECVPCAAGYYKTRRSMDLCDPCEVGFVQPAIGQRQCVPCARGTFQASRGMEECAACGPGTSSDVGSWRCTDCLPGSYATGGEPQCLPCPPGSATDKEGQAECTFCFPGWYAGVGFTECRKCGFFDQRQLTNGVPNGVECTAGVLNGTKPGFWAGQAVDEDSGNWTRVWKCQIEGVCLGGEDSACLEGYAGPLCDSCAPGWFGKPEKECVQCPAGADGSNVGLKTQVCLLSMMVAFLVGSAFALALFKSKNFDQAINFFYRVRTNPILALSQLWAKKHIADVKKRNSGIAGVDASKGKGNACPPKKGSCAVGPTSSTLSRMETMGKGGMSEAQKQTLAIREQLALRENANTYTATLKKTPLGLGCSFNEEGVITEVNADSQAARSGMQRGDQLLTVNGESTMGKEGITARLQDLPVGSSFKVELSRGAARQTATSPRCGTSCEALNRARAASGASSRVSGGLITLDARDLELRIDSPSADKPVDDLEGVTDAIFAKKFYSAHQQVQASRSGEQLWKKTSNAVSATRAASALVGASTRASWAAGAAKDGAASPSSTSGRVALRRPQMQRQKSSIPRTVDPNDPLLSPNARVDIQWRTTVQATSSPQQPRLFDSQPGLEPRCRSSLMAELPSGLPPGLPPGMPPEMPPASSAPRMAATDWLSRSGSQPVLRCSGNNGATARSPPPRSPPPSPPAPSSASSGLVALDLRDLEVHSDGSGADAAAEQAPAEEADLETELKGKGVVRVRLHHGRRLPASDDTTHDGKKDASDPYCKLRLGDEEHKSKTIHKTVNPDWDEEFEFRGQSGDDRPTLRELLNHHLELDVRDSDHLGLGSHELGKVEVDLRPLLTVHVKQMTPRLNTTGYLSLTISWEVEDEYNPLERDLLGKGVVYVHLLRARHLRALEDTTHDGKKDASDPYCRLVLGQSEQRSSTIQDTVSPEWDEVFEFRGDGDFGQRWNLGTLLQAPLELDCFDEGEGMFQMSRELGTSTVDLSPLLRTRQMQLSVPLQPEGVITLMVSWEVEEEQEHESETGEEDVEMEMYMDHGDIYYRKKAKPASGLKWVKHGPEEPIFAGGQIELHNDKLEAALATQTDFTPEEWEAMWERHGGGEDSPHARVPSFMQMPLGETSLHSEHHYGAPELNTRHFVKSGEMYFITAEAAEAIAAEKAKAAVEAKAAAAAAAAAAKKPAKAQPDMLSLSISISILVKFMLFDLVGFFQVNADLAFSMPDIEFPKAFKEMSATLRGIFSLDFVTDWGEGNCSLGSNQCFRVMLCMLCLVAFQLSFPAAVGLVKYIPPLRKRVKKTRLETLVDRAMHGNAIVMMILHPPITKKLVGLVECTYYNDVNVLSSFKDITCGDQQCMYTALAFVPLYTIGIPLYVFLSLRAYLSPPAKKRHAGSPMLARYRARLGFICGKYEPDFWYYELLEMTRKTGLMAITSFIQTGRRSHAPTPPMPPRRVSGTPRATYRP